VIDPLFWLGLSILLVAVSLTAVLVAVLPALQELARAARSAEKLFDTLRRDLPPTLEAIRLTGLEITDLTDNVNDGVKSASHVAKQVDQSLDTAKKQAQNVEIRTRSVFAGVKAAWKSLTRTPNSRRASERLPVSQRRVMQLRVREASGDENQNRAAKLYHTHNTNPETSRQKSRDTSARQTEPEDFVLLDSEDFLPNSVQEDE
jgi:hypothetical protein